MAFDRQLRALEWLRGLVSGKEKEIYVPQKPELKPSDTAGTFEELLPEQAGVRSEGLLKMFAALSEEHGINPHAAVVLRSGKLIAKAEWSPYEMEYPHVSHSLCKSVVSMAVGIAAEERLLFLEEKIADIFAEDMPKNPHKLMKSVTVKHLLTMSSGAAFSEARALMSGDWVRDFLASDVKFQPGTEFKYNSLNTYMLAAAVCKRAGMSLSEYLKKRLFRPMGITNFYWEKCPRGIEKGGWGLYMTVFDYAKLGQLYLNGGVWNGVRLVPESWVRESTAKHMSTSDSPCRGGYGFQIWLTRNGGYVFSGMLGQNVFVYPSRNVVIAVTAGSDAVFPDCRAADIIADFIGNDDNFSNVPIREFRYAEAARLRNALAGARFGTPLTMTSKPSVYERLKTAVKSLSEKPAEDAALSAAKELAGTEVVFEERGGGLLPLLIQAMNGNFEEGVERVSFGIQNDIFTVTLYGGEAADVIPVSLEGMPLYFSLKRRGDVFRIGATGSLVFDEDGFPVLRLELCFTETACTRILKFVFTGDGVLLKFRDSPALYGAIDEAADVILPIFSGTAQRVLDAALETDIAGYQIRKFLEPTIKGNFA